jgi:hypothetical protein
MKCNKAGTTTKIVIKRNTAAVHCLTYLYIVELTFIITSLPNNSTDQLGSMSIEEIKQKTGKIPTRIKIYSNQQTPF